jgi:MYXO-CTERM domain-containing protein
LRPRCEADIAPCFTTFTPLLFELLTGGNGEFTPFYLLSSRGGYLEFLATSDAPEYAIPFSGDEWTDLAWLELGFYQPFDCDVREDLDFTCMWDVALSNLRLTFEADTQTVPEPLGLVPLGVALVGLRRRRAHRSVL